MRVVQDGWSEYVRRITRGHTQAQIAAKADVAESNVGRWMRGERGQPRPDNVIALARAFGQCPAEALIAAGWLTEQDLAGWTREGDGWARTPLLAYSYRELIDELQRRNPED